MNKNTTLAIQDIPEIVEIKYLGNPCIKREIAYQIFPQRKSTQLKVSYPRDIVDLSKSEHLRITFNDKEIFLPEEINNRLLYFFKNYLRFWDSNKYYDCSWFIGFLLGVIREDEIPFYPLNVIINWKIRFEGTDAVEKINNGSLSSFSIIGFNGRNLHYGLYLGLIEGKPLIISKLGKGRGSVLISSFEQLRNAYPTLDEELCVYENPDYKISES